MGTRHSFRKIRFEILERDGFACRYCGADGRDGPLKVDHIIPIAHGGTDAWENLVACCHACNAGKGSGRIRRLPPEMKRAARRTRHLDAASWDVANILWPAGPPKPQAPYLRAIRVLVLATSIQQVRKAAVIARRELPNPEKRLEYCRLLCWKATGQIL